jgi:hypothetical protein
MKRKEIIGVLNKKNPELNKLIFQFSKELIAFSQIIGR